VTTIELAEPRFLRARRFAARARPLAASPATLAAILVLVLLVAFCVGWPFVSGHDPNDVVFAHSDEGPSFAHPLGTDRFGRDLMTRLAIGGRTTLLIAVLALLVVLLVGVVYGTVAGLAGGIADSVMMRIVDGLFALPRLPIAIVILVVLSADVSSVPGVVLALAIAGWMLTARLMRGEVVALKARNFVFAARALGASPANVARRHILPNAAGIVFVAVFLELPTIVLGEAFLSVLGLGPPPPTATWGNMAEQGLHFFRVWEMTVASAAIALFVLSANVIADGLSDVLDPRRAAQVGRRRGRF
jgi:ABC-type dipeptide/oligopeptide/nickel transport system permease subunit